MNSTGSLASMEDSKLIYVNTSKLFVDKTFKEIPAFKPVKKTRLFDDGEYDFIPGINLYKLFSYYFGNNIVLIDRTETITTPFNTSLLPNLRLPNFVETDLSYADCCDKRAKELLELDKPLNIMYSGGIDSTTVLSSLLNNSTKKEQKRMTILLSDASIRNNQEFYDNIISGNLSVKPSIFFEEYLGRKDELFIIAENNDELFGTNLVSSFVHRFDMDILFEEPSLSNLFKLIEKRHVLTSEEDMADIRKCIDLMFLLTSKSPVELDTVYKFFWWLNFCLMWNVSYTRILGFSKQRIIPEENYFSFFSTDYFQLWSMNNVDSLIGEQWRTAKQHAKDYINEYHKNEKYRIDALVGNNLSNICYNKPTHFAIDNNFNTVEINSKLNLFLQENSFV